MPAVTPLFNTPQGGTSSVLSLVSTIRKQTLTGSLDANTVDVQVSLNGESFRSDPTLIEFDQTTFKVPNTNVYPEGLNLQYGVNTIALRAIDTTGSVSSVATATLEILRPDQVDLTAPAPTGIRLRRKSSSVEIVWAESDVNNIRGYNVYASSEAGGGTTGYYRLNRDLITEVSFQEEDLTQDTQDVTFLTNQFGQLNFKLTQQDFTGSELEVSADSDFDISLSGGNLKATFTLETVNTTNYLIFDHNRAANEDGGVINNEVFADVPDTEALYYVITSVVYDPVTGTEVESAYSSELTGLPLIIDSQIRELPRRQRFEVSDAYIQEVLRYDQEVSLIPGSVSRDIFIDPFATEAERLYFISDFIRRSQSFSTLLLVDELPTYKSALAAALGINAATDVQPVIDDGFDKLASNVNVTRQGAEFAVGEAVFYTATEPDQDLIVEEGTTVSTDDGVNFTVTSRTVLPFADRSSYYNLQLQRWEVTANIRATEAGEEGNVAAGEIRNSLGGSSTLRVTNTEATRFGRDEESNRDLAERAILAFSSVDAGTEAGYLATALKQRGVFRAKIVDAGDEYMARDYDEVRDKNIGGKVDVWIQGENQVTVSDTFALQFQVERDVQFFLDSNPADLIFIADDSRLTPETPITAMLGETPSEIAQGFGFRNLTTGETFDLSGVSIIDYNRIQLNTGIPQPAVGPNDLISGDYRFRESDQFVFTRQPVQQVDSVTSLTTGDALVEGTNYMLYKTEDPLLEGYSTQAQDFLQITQAGGVPSGDIVVVNDERHVLLGSIEESLDNLGARALTVRVFSRDRLTEYNGPTATVPDFFITEGSATEPLKITRNPDGNIGNGEEVSVDYEHDENFSVTYVINDLLNDVQDALNIQRHITADVLVKEAISNPLDLECTVVLKKGAVQSVVDAAVRTNVSQHLNSIGIGEPVHQSDIVRLIENTDGVDYVVVPFARLTHSDGNLIVREDVSNSFVFLEQTPTAKIYILQDGLNFATSDGGGTLNNHRGVFQDTQPLTLSESYSNLGNTVNSALIVGASGLIIDGYTDNTTLEAEGYNTPAEREARRLELTANHVLLSLDVSDSPGNHTYEVSYTVLEDTSTESTLLMTDVSYAELGDLTITYREG